MSPNLETAQVEMSNIDKQVNIILLIAKMRLILYVTACVVIGSSVQDTASADDSMTHDRVLPWPLQRARPSPVSTDQPEVSGQSVHLCSRHCLHPHRCTLTLSSKYWMNYMCWVPCTELNAADKDRCSSSAQGLPKYSSLIWPYFSSAVYVRKLGDRKLLHKHVSQVSHFFIVWRVMQIIYVIGYSRLYIMRCLAMGTCSSILVHVMCLDIKHREVVSNNICCMCFLQAFLTLSFKYMTQLKWDGQQTWEMWKGNKDSGTTWTLIHFTNMDITVRWETAWESTGSYEAFCANIGIFRHTHTHTTQSL